MPIVNSKDELVRLFTQYDSKIFYDFSKLSKDANGKLMVGAAMNVDKSAEKTATMLIDAGANVLVIEEFVNMKTHEEFIKWLKDEYPQIEVVAGTVAKVVHAERLIEAGADALRVEMGSFCMFLHWNFVHHPLIFVILGAAHEVKAIVDYVKPKGIPVIADGGFCDFDDISNALSLEASTVMVDMGFIKAMDALPTPRDHYFKSDDAIKVAQVITSVIQMIQAELKNAEVQSLMQLK